MNSRWPALLLAVAGAGFAAACASQPPEPFSGERPVAYLAVSQESLSAFYAAVKDDDGAPVQYETIDIQFVDACGGRSQLRMRFGARSEFARAALQPAAAGWAFTAEEVWTLRSEPTLTVVTFEEVKFDGYARFALTSAERRTLQYPAVEPRPVYDIGGREAVYLGAFELEHVNGQARLKPVDGPDGVFPDGAVEPARAVNVLQACQ
ncbi:MAG: hypothetical protein AAFX09_01965 [Pseudomonadota bacterium]